MLTLPIARVRDAVRRHGVGDTIVAATRLVRGLPGRRARSRRGHRFDELYGVDTAGTVRPSAMDLRGENMRFAHRYEGADPKQLASALDGLEIDYGDFSFIDLGSGKARAVLLAAQRPFRHVIGVELSEQLHRVALENVANASARGLVTAEITLVCGDAATFGFPTGNLVVYLYNPFDEPVFRLVVHNLEVALAAETRDVHVIFWGDRELEPVLDGSSLVRTGPAPVWSSRGSTSAVQPTS